MFVLFIRSLLCKLRNCLQRYVFLKYSSIFNQRKSSKKEYFFQTWKCDVSECAKNLAVNQSLSLERDLAANLTARY